MLTTENTNRAVLHTFEEMAFLDVAPGPPRDGAEEEGPWLQLSYTTPASGAFALFLSKAVKFQVIEAIYGDDWQSVSAVQLDDGLLELMNVLAGHLLSHRFDGAPYAMGLPTILYDPPPATTAKRLRFEYHVDEQPLTLLWDELGV